MLKRSLRLCQAASPISKAEFLGAFARVFPEQSQHDGPQKLGMLSSIYLLWSSLRSSGIAVSGGVDSMALAAMCREYLPADKVELHAFVVDHGLRITSTMEAIKTHQTLVSKLGMPTDIEASNAYGSSVS
jgi:3'-phosphoadenosine 5'-phosphosulfate sulfotransferase (PAPS reductase)/FAD synthetase